MFFRVLSIALLFAPSVAGAAAANDLVLRQRITVESTTLQPHEQMQYYTPSVRITDDDRGRTIIDLDHKTFTIIDKKKQTYSVITFAELRARGDSADDRIKSLPPNVRQMVHADDKVQLQPTGATETIAGFKAKEYNITSPGIAGTVWATEDLHLNARAKEWADVTTLMGGKHSPGGQLDAALAELKLFPLRETITMEPLPQSTTEVLEAHHGPPPRELLLVPAGYQKVAPPKPRSPAKQ